MSTPRSELTILSHHKCATNWLRSICRELARNQAAEFSVRGGQSDKGEEIKNPGTPKILLNVNATIHAYTQFSKSANRNVHFVRDPRDALVSNYFSWLYSHKKTNDKIVNFRDRAQTLTFEEGMSDLVDLFPMGEQLESWTDEMWASCRLIKYEDLIADFDGTLTSILSPLMDPLPEHLIRSIRENTEFKKMAGRNSGVEDQKSHFRKGLPGDYKNYFSEGLGSKFYKKYGWLGRRLGYW